MWNTSETLRFNEENGTMKLSGVETNSYFFHCLGKGLKQNAKSRCCGLGKAHTLLFFNLCHFCIGNSLIIMKKGVLELFPEKLALNFVLGDSFKYGKDQKVYQPRVWQNSFFQTMPQLHYKLWTQ